jgi:hypothetical protein
MGGRGGSESPTSAATRHLDSFSCRSGCECDRDRSEPGDAGGGPGRQPRRDGIEYHTGEAVATGIASASLDLVTAARPSLVRCGGVGRRL